MAGNLNAGYNNNVNTVAIREAGNNAKVYTDRAIDLDSDGNVEVVTVTREQRAGSKVKLTVTEPDGIARSPVKRLTETDGGVNTTGSEFEEGVA